MEKGEQWFWRRIVFQSVTFMLIATVLFTFEIYRQVTNAEISFTIYIVPLVSNVLFFGKGFISLKFWVERRNWQYILFTVLLAVNTLYRLFTTVYFSVYYDETRLIASIVCLVIFVGCSNAGRHIRHQLRKLQELHPQGQAEPHHSRLQRAGDASNRARPLSH